MSMNPNYESEPDFFLEMQYEDRFISDEDLLDFGDAPEDDGDYM